MKLILYLISHITKRTFFVTQATRSARSFYKQKEKSKDTLYTTRKKGVGGPQKRRNDFCEEISIRAFDKSNQRVKRAQLEASTTRKKEREKKKNIFYFLPCPLLVLVSGGQNDEQFGHHSDISLWWNKPL